jgi:hypothetical protein
MVRYEPPSFVPAMTRFAGMTGKSPSGTSAPRAPVGATSVNPSADPVVDEGDAEAHASTTPALCGRVAAASGVSGRTGPSNEKDRGGKLVDAKSSTNPEGEAFGQAARTLALFPPTPARSKAPFVPQPDIDGPGNV